MLDLGWTRPDENVVSMDLVKLNEPLGQNCWLTRERFFLAEVDTERRMRQSRGRIFGYLVNWDSVEYFSLSYANLEHLFVQCDSK